MLLLCPTDEALIAHNVAQNRTADSSGGIRMVKPIRVAVVGTNIGCTLHVRALRAAGFEVTALVGRNPMSGIAVLYVTTNNCVGAYWRARF